jgi:kinetochore protein Nuf2
MAAPEVLTFPILSPLEIVDICRELNIKLELEELQNPTSEKISKVYEEFLMLASNYKPEEDGSDFTKFDRFDYPQMHEQSVGFVAFLRSLMQLAEACGYPQISTRDLIKPEVNRIVKFLSAVINYLRFRNEKIDSYEQLCTDTERLRQLRDQTSVDFAKASAELARLRSARQTEKPLAAEMLRDRVKLEDDLSQQQRRYAELQKHAERLNAHRQDLKDRLVEKDQRLDSERRECSGLRAQLVQSPDRMKRELSNKENSLEEESKATQALETQGRSLTDKVDKIKKVQSDLSQVMGTLSQCEEQLDKTRTAQKDSRDLQKRVQEQRNKLREIEMNMTVNEKQLHYAQQRFESSEEHGRSRVEDSQKEMRRAVEGKAKAEQVCKPFSSSFARDLTSS